MMQNVAALRLINDVNVAALSQPQASYSTYRGASLDIWFFRLKNRMHAYSTWHLNHKKAILDMVRQMLASLQIVIPENIFFEKQ